MQFLVILLIVVWERFFIHSFYFKKSQWWHNYFALFPQGSSYLNLIAVVTPLVIAVIIVKYLLLNIFWGILLILFNIFVLYFCIGLDNLFYTTTENYFTKINDNLIAVFFWYILLGLPGAICYRAVSYFCKINLAVNYLNWLPARFTSCLYLLAGDFQQGLASLKENFFNKNVLENTGSAALSNSSKREFGQSVITIFLVLFALLTLALWF